MLLTRWSPPKVAYVGWCWSCRQMRRLETIAHVARGLLCRYVGQCADCFDGEPDSDKDAG